MINLDDVQDGIKELERAARLGLSGAMIPEYPLEQRRSDQSEYEPFWAAAAALDLPLSLHTASATARRFTRSRACPREGGGPALAKAGDGMLPSDFFRRNVALSFQQDAIGIRLRDVIGPDNMMWDNMMWGSDYPHSESTFPQSRKILAEILAGVPDDEQAKIAGGNAARVYNFDVARVTVRV